MGYPLGVGGGYATLDCIVSVFFGAGGQMGVCIFLRTWPGPNISLQGILLDYNKQLLFRLFVLVHESGARAGGKKLGWT